MIVFVSEMVSMTLMGCAGPGGTAGISEGSAPVTGVASGSSGEFLNDNFEPAQPLDPPGLVYKGDLFKSALPGSKVHLVTQQLRLPEVRWIRGQWVQVFGSVPGDVLKKLNRFVPVEPWDARRVALLDRKDKSMYEWNGRMWIVVRGKGSPWGNPGHSTGPGGSGKRPDFTSFLPPIKHSKNSKKPELKQPTNPFKKTIPHPKKKDPKKPDPAPSID